MKLIMKSDLSFYTTATVIAVAVCLIACTNQPLKNSPAETAAGWESKRLSRYNTVVFAKAAAVIKTGDMITRLGTDITSEMICQLNQTDKSFSHCGIASLEHDTLFVYHAIGGEFNPDQKLKREELYTFCHPSESKSVGIFEIAMDSITIKKLITDIQEIYQKGTLFDMDFDYKTDDRLYCAEFVSKSYSKAISDSSWFTFTTKGHFKYVAVDNLFLNKSMREKMRCEY